MGWQERKPVATDVPNLELPSLITSNKLVFRQAIEKHSFWTDSSGASVGLPRLSDGSFGPGSARAYFDTQSQMSISDASQKAMKGRLYITSDTSRLFGYASETTSTLLGSVNAIVYQIASQATAATNTRVLVQIGTAPIVITSSGTSTGSVVFGKTYNVAPQVQVTPRAPSANSSALNPNVVFSFPAITAVSTSGFSVALRTFNSGLTLNFSTDLLWRSHGSVGL